MMRHYFNTHGKHCFLRSFQTQCRKCCKDVLYWECRHGSKLFFEYPPYGKLVRHYCRKVLGKNIKNKYPVIVKTPEGLLKKASPSCPVCGKLFKSEIDLHLHLKQLKKTDEWHESFFESQLASDSDRKIKKKDLKKSKDKLIFGKINIRDEKKDKYE